MLYKLGQRLSIQHLLRNVLVCNYMRRELNLAVSAFCADRNLRLVEREIQIYKLIVHKHLEQPSVRMKRLSDLVQALLRILELNFLY